MIKTHGLRRSHHIRGREASKFFKAAKHSEGQARALNRFVTVNLSHTACPEQQASQVTSQLCSKFTRWLRYQSQKAMLSGHEGYGAPTYGTVIENPRGRHHVHWLVHVPDELMPLFEESLPKWLAKTAGKIIVPEGLIDSSRPRLDIGAPKG